MFLHHFFWRGRGGIFYNPFSISSLYFFRFAICVFPSLFPSPVSPYSFSFPAFICWRVSFSLSHIQNRSTAFTKTNINTLLWKILKAKRSRNYSVAWLAVDSIERGVALEGSEGGATSVVRGQDPIILCTDMKLRGWVLKG